MSDYDAADNSRDARKMRARMELEDMPLSKRIDQSFQRSVSRWAAWRRKRMEEEAVTAATTEALRAARAA